MRHHVELHQSRDPVTLVVGRIKVLRLDAQRLFRVEFVGDIAYENVGYVGLTLETMTRVALLDRNKQRGFEFLVPLALYIDVNITPQQLPLARFALLRTQRIESG